MFPNSDNLFKNMAFEKHEYNVRAHTHTEISKYITLCVREE